MNATEKVSDTDIASAGSSAAAFQSRKTRLEIIALFAEIIAALAVVASVIYLAMQMSTNNRLMQAQSSNNIMEVIHTNMLQLARDGDFAELSLRCAKDPYGVNEVEWLRCASFYHGNVDLWEYAYHQYQNGTLGPSHWHGIAAAIDHFSKTDLGFQRFWRERSDFYGRDFFDYADPIIPDISPPEDLALKEVRETDEVD